MSSGIWTYLGVVIVVGGGFWLLEKAKTKQIKKKADKPKEAVVVTDAMAISLAKVNARKRRLILAKRDDP